ncbi:hypothetical protein FDECE_9524 [Fusarium decemcellulare]|nr:hypothetical protein FDECE_9524 [Fusarium decemcellulare]
MAPLWSSQPFKAVYTIYFLIKTPPLLILLFIKYLVKPLRPFPAWGPIGNLVRTMTKMVFEYIVTTRAQRVLGADPTVAKERHVKVEPAADRLYTGVLAATEATKPGQVDAIWLLTLPPSQDDAAEWKKQKIALHFPAGAFIMEFNHNLSGWEVADALSKNLKVTRTVWAQYRLSGTPETCFPAALQDALTFYRYVLSLGVDPENVILSGDSAGGNLVIALLRYLETSQPEAEKLPLPAGAIVFSPWVHITAQAGEDYEHCEYSQSDLLLASLLQWGAESYLPKGQLSDEVEAYISPLHHPFELSVPLYVQDGAAEALHASIKSFVEEMIQLNGDRVRLHSTKLAPHDILLSHKGFGMTEDLYAAIREAYELFENAK